MKRRTTASGRKLKPNLRSMLLAEELRRRPSRPADYGAENQALIALAQELARSPEGILQKLVDSALGLCRAHSAGLSLLEEGDGKSNFHWRAIAGQWASHVNGGTPRNFGPCGTVLDQGVAMICSHPEVDFPYWEPIRPVLEEALLIPFFIKDEAVGTIWIVAHDTSRRFDAEDLRVMTNLGVFAATAYQTLLTLNAAQRVASIVQSSHDAIVGKDLNGMITSWNGGAERIFGYMAEEVIGQPIMILIPPDRHNEETAILDRVRRGERIGSYETVRRRKDGSPVDVSLTVSPLMDTADRVIGASKIARDITERVYAERALRESEAQLAQEHEVARQLQQVSLELLSNRPELLYERILDAAIVVMRSQAASMQIFEPDTGILKLLAGRGFHPDAATFWDRVDCNTASTCGEALKTGRRVLVSDTETCAFMAGTEGLEAYRLSNLRAVQSTPLRSRNGRTLGMVSTHWREPHEPSNSDFSRFDVLAREAADMLERAQTEASLRQSEARLQAAVDLVKLGRYEWNPQSNELQWDDTLRAMWGLAAGAPVDYEVWRAGIHPGDQARVEAAIERCVDPRGDGVYEVEYRVIGKADGVERWIATRGQTSFENNTPVSFFGIALEVTDHKLVEGRLERRVEERTRELQEANRQLRSQMEKREVAEAEVQQLQRLDAIGQITSGVAHDFNNLLSVVLTNANLLSRTVQGPDDQEGVELIRNAAERGAKLIAQLLAFSRQQQLEPHKVDLNSKLVGMDNLFRVILGGTLQFKTRFAPDLWPALVDPNQIEMIVLNLAINARDAMQPGGTLTVETFNTMIESAPSRPEQPLPGDYVALAVKDTGIGIPDEVLPHVFEPFFTTKEAGKGSGLGLAQVFGFAKQSCGGVRIETGLGRGTAVTIFLPRAAADVSDDQADVVDASNRAQTSKRLRVLVVDDDKAVLKSTVRILEFLGYATASAESGNEALRLLARDQEIDVVLADFAMPEMSGGELAKAIRAMRPTLPVILMTGYSDRGPLKELKDWRIILKPFTENDLVNTIEAALK
ncbi:PAS domain S-box-containing protein [Rhizobium sp. BK181]|uniref:PAS domain S-box protein n=1 Tax=Rhizobium sp. BK181 TaxID=2587072 RepID=UPI0016221DBE|nr:PAS domain S-box protein [Rhizobium sp. BK181]MBB3319598.1 PAS domain S-box-containing protein [Rhizobium sp. BK181]